ncbi:MAG: flagellar FliJ family protein [Oscillospiraceae bacterium]
MKKFIFSLEKVLNFKGQSIDALKNQLAILQSELHLIEQEIAKLNLIFVKKNVLLREKMQEGISSGEISTFKIYLNDINLSIRRKQFELKLKKDEVFAKQQEIISANIEIASLEKLKDTQLQDYKKAFAKSQEIELNEFITNAMQRQKV